MKRPLTRTRLRLGSLVPMKTVKDEGVTGEEMQTLLVKQTGEKDVEAHPETRKKHKPSR